MVDKKLYFREYYIKHRDKILQQVKQYRESHKADKAEYDLSYQRENKAKVYAKNKRWEVRHRIQTRKIHRHWSDKNKEKTALYRSRSYYKHIEKRRLEARAQHFDRNGNGKLKVEIMQRAYEDNIKKYGTLTCVYCLKAIAFGNDSVDHKVPLSRGGTHEYENITIACRRCNYQKKDKTVEEYQCWLKEVHNVRSIRAEEARA